MKNHRSVSVMNKLDAKIKKKRHIPNPTVFKKAMYDQTGVPQE